MQRLENNQMSTIKATGVCQYELLKNSIVCYAIKAVAEL